jgi:hypothetical protein
MRVEFLQEPSAKTLAWELIDDERAGEFVLVGGSVRYRHDVTGEIFAAHNLSSFRDAVAAWERYGEKVRAASDETSEELVVAQLRNELSACGALTEAGFWSVILEQAEIGLL